MPTLSAEERATLTTRLAEAEGVLHDVMLGNKARTFVDQNGERVEFTVANSGKLRTYIMELKSKLGIQTVSGPMQARML